MVFQRLLVLFVLLVVRITDGAVEVRQGVPELGERCLLRLLLLLPYFLQVVHGRSVVRTQRQGVEAHQERFLDVRVVSFLLVLLPIVVTVQGVTGVTQGLLELLTQVPPGTKPVELLGVDPFLLLLPWNTSRDRGRRVPVGVREIEDGLSGSSGTSRDCG